MMDRVDLDVSQARADLLPDKYARRRVRGTLAIRRLSSQHCKRSMSECDVCTGWLLLLFLFWSLHHVIHSNHWQSFKRRHAVLVWFVSLPVVLCWYVLCVCFVSLVALGRGAGRICKIRWNEFMESDAVCDGAVMLGLYGELISDAWLFLERHWPTTEIHVMYMYIELRLRGVKRSKVTKQPRLREVRRSKVTKEPTIRVVYVLVLSCGMGWAWFRSLLTSTGPSHLVIRQLLIISGDVELNPGPLDHEIEQILSEVDDTCFEEDDWNILIDECSSLCARWDRISGFLGLRPSLISSIRRNNPNDSAGCWNDALLEWVTQNYNTEKFGEPSWKTFLTAVAKVEKLHFKKLAAEHQAKAKADVHVSAQMDDTSGAESSFSKSEGAAGGSPDSTGLHKPPSLATSPRSHLHPALKRRSSRSRSLGRVFKLLSKARRKSRSREESKDAEGGTPGTAELGRAPSSPPSVNLSPEEKQRCYERVSSKSHEMAYKFQNLFTSVRKSLWEEKVTVPELVRHLECLGSIKPIYKDLGKNPLRRELPELASATSVDGVMSIVKNYCSFFNCQMLAHIIDEFGTPKDKENLLAYKKDFEEYAQCCVIEGSMEVGKMSEEGFSNMFVTLDDSFDNCALSHLNVFIADLRKVLNISSDVDLRLCRINCGSIKLIFQLPLSLGQDIFPLSPEQEASLAALGVVELSCGGYQFTRQQNKEVDDPCDSDEGYPDYADSDSELVSMATGLTLQDKPSIIITDSGLGRSRHTRTVATEDTLHRPDVEFTDTGMGMRHGSSAFELHLASKNGDLETVKLLTEKRLSPLQEDKQGLNAIHYAAGGGKLPVLKYFIEERGHNPASPCSTGSKRTGWTPLHVAAQFNHLELVQYLIDEQQVDPMCQTESGDTPLHKACHRDDNMAVVIYLVNAMSQHLPLEDVVSCRGIDGQTPLHSAALRGQLKIVKYLTTELYCNPNIIVITGEHHGRTTKCGGRIALHHAAQEGHLHVMKFLIEDQHCNPSHCDYGKRTPLHMAAQQGHLSVVEYLTLKHHCDPLCTNMRNNTPLHLAASNGHLQVVRFMIETLHCPPDIRGQHNATPLHMAAQEGHLSVVEYLTLKHHCDPLCTAQDNNTPLHYAALDGHLQVVRFMIETLHCPPDIRGWNNETPLDTARRRGHRHVVKYLESIIMS